MGYTAFSENEFSRAWVPDVSGAAVAGLALGMRKGVVAHGLKLTLISDFLQANIGSYSKARMTLRDVKSLSFSLERGILASGRRIRNADGL
jgi:hypothetical protein